MTDVRIPAPLSPEHVTERADRLMAKCRRRQSASLADVEQLKNDVHDLAAELDRARVGKDRLVAVLGRTQNKFADIAAERDELKKRVAELEAERHETNDALADITVAQRAERDAAEAEVASSNAQWEHWAREAERLQKRVAELEAERLRAGRLAEQRHQYRDLDTDSACPAGFVCPAAHTAPELEATA